MAENNKIYIHISSINNGSGIMANQSITTGNVATKTSQQPKKAGEQNEENQLIATILINEGKKIMSSALSNYANITGDSITSSRLNTISQVISYGLAIWKGGVVGAIYTATDIALKQTANFINTKRTNDQIELMRERVGMSNLNGSRDTNG